MLGPNVHNNATERLKYAFTKCSSAKVEQALREGANIHDSSLLHSALITRVKKIVKLLLNQGVIINTFYPNLNLPDTNGAFEIIGVGTPVYEGPGNALSVALFLNDPSLIYLLLRYGATVKQEEQEKKSWESTTIKKLVKSLRLEGVVLSALIDDDPTALQEFCTKSVDNNPPLIELKHKNTKFERLKKLLRQPQKPFTLNTPNKYGKTPLMLAAVAGKEQIVRFLLHAHVNTEITDNQGNTAHMLAFQEGNIEIAKLIKSHLLSCRKRIFISIIKKIYMQLDQHSAEKIADFIVSQN